MATKKKELLEQEAPVTETVMSEGETLPADTAPVSYTHLDVYKRQGMCCSVYWSTRLLWLFLWAPARPQQTSGNPGAGCRCV